MAITLQASPSQFYPAYVENWWLLSSNNVNNDQFSYNLSAYTGSYVFANDYNMPPRPGDGYGQVNIQTVLASQMGFHLSPASSGFTVASGHCIQYNVAYSESSASWPFTDNLFSGGLVGFTGTTAHGLQMGDKIIVKQDPGYVNESYQGFATITSVPNSTSFVTDKGFAQGTPLNPGKVYKENGSAFQTNFGSATTKYLLGVVIGRNELQNWNISDYNLTANGKKFLCDAPNSMQMFRENYAQIAIYNSGINQRYLRVNTYGDNGAVVGSYRFSNPYSPRTTAGEYVLHFGIGPKNLSTAAGYTVLYGPATIINSAVTSYKYFTMNSATTFSSQTKTIELKNNYCIKPNFQLLALDQKGSWMPFNFCMNSSEFWNINRKVYKKPIGIRPGVGSVPSYSTQDRGFSVYNTDIKKSFEISSGWLTDDEAEYMMQLLESPEVYHIDPVYGALPIIIANGSYPRDYNYDGLVSYSIKFQYAFDESVQQF